MATKAALENISIFNGLTDSQRDQIAAKGREISAPAGEVLFRAGDAADRMYCILAGQVQVYLPNIYGEEVPLATLGAGASFGEMALLDGGTRSASVVTLTACQLYVLDRQVFLELLPSSPQVLLQQLADLSRRIRESDQQMVRERLAQETLRADAEANSRRQLTQLVAGVSHEVNTPLGIINTAASVMLRALASDGMQAVARDLKTKEQFEELLEAATLIQKHILRAHQLIQSFKKLSVDQIIETKEAVNLSEAIAETVDLFRTSARKAKLELIVTDTLSEETRQWVGYRGYLSRILLNLFTNIESYAYPDGAGGQIQISVAFDPRRPTPAFSIKVTDFGQGIAAEHLSRVCEPFFTTGRAKGGTGLGLTIVDNLVRQVFQGSLTIDSQLGLGTTVHLTFPQTIVN